MLGRSSPLLIPEVIGFRLSGSLSPGATATDLVLTVTQMLRKGVVNKFVEFYGDGLGSLTVADRATIGNMSPEYGATIGFFPVDAQTLAYLRLTGREEHQINLIEPTARPRGSSANTAHRTPPSPTLSNLTSLKYAPVSPVRAARTTAFYSAAPSASSAESWLRKSLATTVMALIPRPSSVGSARAAILKSLLTSASLRPRISARLRAFKLSATIPAPSRFITARW